MSESEGKLRVVAETDEAAANIDRVADSLGRLQQEAEGIKNARMGFREVEQGAGAAEESTSGLVETLGAARGALLALGAREAVRGIVDLIERTDQLDTAIDRLNGASIRGAREFAGGMVPALDLVTARTRMLQAGLELTDQEFEAVIAKGIVFAQANGIQASAGIQQLTSALISGNDRGLRPFGFELEAGASRARNLSTALDQITQAAEANRRAVEEDRGAFDMLKSAIEDVDHDLGVLFRTMYDDGPKVLFQNAKSLNDVLAGRESLRTAAEQASERVMRLLETFTAGTPVIGSMVSSVNALAREYRDAAMAALGFARAVRDLEPGDFAPDGAVGRGERDPALFRSTLRRGGAVLAPGESNYSGPPRNRVEWMRRMYPDDPTGARLAREQDAAISEALASAPRGGGGGGGGARDDRTIEEALAGIADAAQRRVDAIAADLEEQERRLRELAAEEDAGGFGSGGSDAFLRGGFGERAGAFNQERRGGGPGRPAGGARNPSQQVSAMARSTDAAVKYADALTRLGEVGGTALGALTSAVTANVEAWVVGEKTIGQALLGILSQTLQTIAKESAVKAILYTAEGFAALVTMNGPAAASAFTAAGFYTAAAAAAGLGSMAVSGMAGGASAGQARGRYQGGSAAVSAHSGAVEDRGAPAVVVQYNLAPGAVVGDSRRAGEQLARMTRASMRRAARIQHRPEPQL